MAIKTLLLNDIRIDGGTQSRVSIDLDTVARYAEMDEGDLPPIIVFFDGANHWLAEGFHRLHAAFKRGKKANIIADVRKGTQRDAVFFSLSANVKHGLTLTSEDKRKAVLIMLTDPEWRELSDRAIARHCGCSHMTVGRLRNGDPEPERTLTAATSTAAIARPPESPQSNGLPGKTDDEVTGKQQVEKKPTSPDVNDKATELTEVDALKSTLARQEGWLRRIGNALGEDDFSKLPALVEAMKRGLK